MKTLNIPRHCEIDECSKWRPKGWSQTEMFFSLASDDEGRHIYVGPCHCPCAACAKSARWKGQRLDSRGAPRLEVSRAREHLATTLAHALLLHDGSKQVVAALDEYLRAREDDP